MVEETGRSSLSGAEQSSSSRLDISKDTIISFEKRNTNILVADDDDAISQLIQEVLQAEQFPVTLSSSGPEALDCIKREDFGMIITDIKLREFDGMGLLKAAKVINPRTDVIIITGYPTVETAVTAMRFGAAEYFTKPFSVEQLRKSVNRLIEKRILERKLKVEKHQMELQRLDDETGLFTNRYFHLVLSQEINRSARFSHKCGLLLTQMNGLKVIQESELDSASMNGDSLFKSLSRALRGSCRQIDFVSRYSYDEFAFVLPESDAAGVEAVSDRIRRRIDALNAEVKKQGYRVVLEPIFGGALYPDSATTKEQLLSKANEQLVKARP